MRVRNQVVVTGAAGFIGMHLVENLTRKGFQVVGIDSFRSAYGGVLCNVRSDYLKQSFDLNLQRLDVADSANLQALVSLFTDSLSVIHLAAWPGVRQSQLLPNEYSKSNLTGFANVLEAVRIAKPRQFMFASSSSIYGDLGISGAVKEDSATGQSLRSYYAATKWANEILAQQYAQISEVPTIALRFFTVFGEYGRPDMAYWSFLEKTLEGKTIDLYGENGGVRNFTYVKDCVEAVSKLVDVTALGFLPVNIALDNPRETIDLLNILSKAAGKPPQIQIVKRPIEDVEKTWADQSLLRTLIGDLEPTPLETAVSNFVEWFTDFGSQ
jgi:UDP-glucuronate 4-epimerase